MNDQNKALLKRLVAQPAKFRRYHDTNLWYGIGLFEFPVPISDIGVATFNAEEKGLLMMRYIRKHLETMEAGNV